MIFRRERIFVSAYILSLNGLLPAVSTLDAKDAYRYRITRYRANSARLTASADRPDHLVDLDLFTVNGGIGAKQWPFHWHACAG